MAGYDSLEERYQRARATLEMHGQAHVLRYWDGLARGERELLLGEIESIRWQRLAPLIESHVRQRPDEAAPEGLSPAPVHPLVPETPEEHELYAQAVVRGQELIAGGRVAAFTVAGGQGSRLGFEGPKGAVSVSPVRGKSLFQIFAETLSAVGDRNGVALRWYIMTSPANHRQTLDFLAEHDWFGLPSGDVRAFEQGMLPSFDREGRILMIDRHRLALAPDGHGGSLAALERSASLDDMSAHGVGIISYFQVDNPLVQPFDPLFIGLHDLTGSQMSTKVARKAHDLERVGNLCLKDGRVCVVEYSDFPDAYAHAQNADGSRRFDLGNLGIHLLDVDFVRRVAANEGLLPHHRADKAIAALDGEGVLRTPEEPNGVKLETFIFDALPLAESPLLLEIDRNEEFSPVKNASGSDSVDSCRADQLRRATRWLEAAGLEIARGKDGLPRQSIEIAPSFALSSADVRRRIAAGFTLPRDEAIYLE